MVSAFFRIFFLLSLYSTTVDDGSAMSTALKMLLTIRSTTIESTSSTAPMNFNKLLKFFLLPFN